MIKKDRLQDACDEPTKEKTEVRTDEKLGRSQVMQFYNPTVPGKFQTRHEPENGRLLPGQVYVLPSKEKQNAFN